MDEKVTMGMPVYEPVEETVDEKYERVIREVDVLLRKKGLI